MVLKKPKNKGSGMKEDALESGELLPIALLIDELKHDDIAVRLNSFHKIDLIAQALGPERTRSDFLPFLTAIIEDEEDEILVTLATTLGNLVEQVGGAAYAHELLIPLELLCSVDELSVADAAIHSIKKIVELFSRAQIDNYFLPLVENAARKPGAAKKSAPMLISIAFSITNSEQKQNLLL